MLAFFIHGVATRDVKYADNLKELIRQEFIKRNQPLPHFYSSFWGDVLSDVDKMWNCIYQDVESARKNTHQITSEDLFRYQKFRKGFLSEFIGDVFTYFNLERGLAIRKKIAQQLHDFLKNHPDDEELHIIAHSLGSVILWDILFSDRFNAKDLAFYIRSMIGSCNEPNVFEKVRGMINETNDNPTLATIYSTLKDDSGTVRLFVNKLNVHHVYIFDNDEVCQFAGYVGWLHTSALQEELELLEKNFCL